MEAPKASILVVDDDLLIIEMICAFLTCKGYLCRQAATLDEALKIINRESIDVSIVDVFLKNESGVALVKELSNRQPPIPSIVITGIEDENIARLALDAGAYGYLTKPFSFLELLVNIEGVLKRRRLEELRDRYNCELEDMVKERTRHLEIALNLQRQIITGVVQAISEVVEVRDPYTSGHQYRTAQLASAISKLLGLDKEKIESIYLSSLLHDIGKISVPAEILTKPGKLDSVEFELIKRHPLVGYKILKNIPFPFPIHDIVIQHHERLNGLGYPRGLKGNEIMMEARIIAVADVVEAMMTHRPYRPAFGLDATLEEVSRQKGKSLDQDAVECCIELFKSRNFSLKEKKPISRILQETPDI
ncbi:MAG: response regulator [Syntrophobacterales bacterium]|nr:response regulator [Syntrophobacterales bacterium]